MRVDIKRFVFLFLMIVVIDAAAFAAVFVPRVPLGPDGWAFLERQRPLSSGSMFWCHDCLNFAVFRRGFGGWETASARMLELVNLPGFVAAELYFNTRQRQAIGSSKGHSDEATLILVMVSLAQSALIALVPSMRRKVRTGA